MFILLSKEYLIVCAFKRQVNTGFDVFEIKQFLPREYADTVVFPSALVQKDSSDFDIDKRSLYLKNVYKDRNGYPKLVEYLNDENSTTDFRYGRYVRYNKSNSC